MRNRRFVWFSVVLLAVSSLSGGCIDGVKAGIQGGVEAAISTAIETIIGNALTPITERE